MSSSSYGGGGPGLGSAESKTYSPYGGSMDGGNVTSMGSMGSMGSGSSMVQQESSYMQKSMNMVSSMKNTVVDSAGAVGQAMGFKAKGRGILNENLPFGSQQFPANYNPPTSISSSSS